MGYSFIFTLNFVLLAVCCGCASQITISSQPSGSEVYVRNEKTGAEISLGKTPISTTFAELQSKLDTGSVNGEFFQLHFKKKKYLDRELILPASRWNTLKTYLHVELDVDTGVADQKSHLMIQYLLNAQKFINEGLFDRALYEVERVLNLEPRFAWGHLMRGQVEYLNRRFKESLRSYEKALELDPQNEQAQKMLIVVRRRLETEPKQ